jgi:hypothetical protein
VTEDEPKPHWGHAVELACGEPVDTSWMAAPERPPECLPVRDRAFANRVKKRRRQAELAKASKKRNRK